MEKKPVCDTIRKIKINNNKEKSHGIFDKLKQGMNKTKSSF